VALSAGLLAIVFAPRDASAQVRWDVGVQAGIMRRVLSDRPDFGDDAGFGPVGELHAHVAVIPMLRAGAYVSHDISPVNETSRHITSFGGRFKLTPPWPSSELRAFAFAGFGYALAYELSYSGKIRNTNGGVVDATVPGVSGHYFEVPVGLGATYRLRKPWEISAELGARVGFAFSGDAYSSNGIVVAGDSYYGIAPVPGQDALAIYLALGVSLDL
jgi:hypothetical protein